MSTHLQLIRPTTVFHAIYPFLLLNRAVFHGSFADSRLALLVAIQNIHELVVVGRALFLDLSQWFVVLP